MLWAALLQTRNLPEPCQTQSLQTEVYSFYLIPSFLAEGTPEAPKQRLPSSKMGGQCDHLIIGPWLQKSTLGSALKNPALPCQCSPAPAAFRPLLDRDAFAAVLPGTSMCCCLFPQQLPRKKWGVCSLELLLQNMGCMNNKSLNLHYDCCSFCATACNIFPGEVQS